MTRRSRPDRGASLVEMAVAMAILSIGIFAGLSLISRAADGFRRTRAEQEAVRIASAALEAIERELRDAPASTVDVSADRPGRISFRRVVGYDPSVPDPDARVLLSPEITISTAAFRVPGAPDLLEIVRTQASGAPAVGLGGYVGIRDPAAPSLPGLHFDVVRLAASARVEVVVVVEVPSAGPEPARARRSTSVCVAAQP